MCARSIRARHARELVRVAQAHREAGGRVYFMTLTLRHGYGDALRPLRRGLTDAWRRLVRGAPWQRWADEVGWVGYARSIDITHGVNGWHPHLHALAFTRHAMTAADARALAERWRAVVIAELGAAHAPDVDTVTSAPSERVVLATPGLRVDRCHAGDREATYLAKLGLEVAGPGKTGGRTQWAVLADAVREVELATADRDGSVDVERLGRERGDWTNVWRWRAYARAMRGARCLTWSRRLRELYAPEEDDDATPTGRVALTFSGRAWSLVRERDAEVLDVAREHGAHGVLAWLRERDPIAFLETLALSGAGGLRGPPPPADAGPFAEALGPAEIS